MTGVEVEKKKHDKENPHGTDSSVVIQTKAPNALTEIILTGQRFKSKSNYKLQEQSSTLRDCVFMHNVLSKQESTKSTLRSSKMPPLYLINL